MSERALRAEPGQGRRGSRVVRALVIAMVVVAALVVLYAIVALVLIALGVWGGA